MKQTVFSDTKLSYGFRRHSRPVCFTYVSSWLDWVCLLYCRKQRVCCTCYGRDVEILQSDRWGVTCSAGVRRCPTGSVLGWKGRWWRRAMWRWRLWWPPRTREGCREAHRPDLKQNVIATKAVKFSWLRMKNVLCLLFTIIFQRGEATGASQVIDVFVSYKWQLAGRPGRPGTTVFAYNQTPTTPLWWRGFQCWKNEVYNALQ